MESKSPHWHLINYCQLPHASFCFHYEKKPLSLLKWLWNVSLFLHVISLVIHLHATHFLLYSHFSFPHQLLFVNYSFRKSARVSICFHNFLLLLLIIFFKFFFCFSRNRDLKLIWMNMKFHGRLQNMLLSNYERIIIWKFQNQNKNSA